MGPVDPVAGASHTSGGHQNSIVRSGIRCIQRLFGCVPGFAVPNGDLSILQRHPISLISLFL